MSASKSPAQSFFCPSVYPRHVRARAQPTRHGKSVKRSARASWLLSVSYSTLFQTSRYAVVAVFTSDFSCPSARPLDSPGTVGVENHIHLLRTLVLPVRPLRAPSPSASAAGILVTDGLGWAGWMDGSLTSVRSLARTPASGRFGWGAVEPGGLLCLSRMEGSESTASSDECRRRHVFIHAMRMSAGRGWSDGFGR
ncbi:hypothetical protein BKA80DRAFT_144125 [Phyllosticta citrichinensis]